MELQVILKEVAAVQAACTRLDPEYRPGITFVVVQKRHHTRLFCENKSDQVSHLKDLVKQVNGHIPFLRLERVAMFLQELLLIKSLLILCSSITIKSHMLAFRYVGGASRVHTNTIKIFVLHIPSQGTSRPCHYQVLWDDNNFTPDQLQMLSYQLCHAYARCNRSVSYPAPTYYAHHVAFRARYKLQEWEDKK